MSDNRKKKKPRGQRGDGRVVRTLTIGKTPEGKQIQKFFYGATLAEAEAKRTAYKFKLSLGMSSKNLTLGEWIDIYKENYRKRVNPAYLNIDDIPYNRLKNALGDKKLSDVRELHLQNTLNSVSGKSVSTIRTYYQVIFRVFDRARKNKLILDNPAEGLIIPGGTRGTHRAIERWESDCIIQNWQVHRGGLWAMLMMLCGLRRSEMMGLKWENIDMEKRTLTVQEVAIAKGTNVIIEDRTKTPAGRRVIPLCEPMFLALDSIPEESRTGFVCKREDGSPLTESTFARGWSGFNLAMQRVLNNEPVVQAGRRETLEKKIEAAAKEGREYIIFKIRAHDLRHTFATALYDAGVPLKAAQYYLGHSDTHTTLDIYTHLSEERKKESRSQLTTFLDTWLEQEKHPDEETLDKKMKNEPDEQENGEEAENNSEEIGTENNGQ